MKARPGNFSSWLRKADLYGQTPTFLYNGDMACKSQFGGMVSILVVIAYSLCVFFTIWRYFEKSSPETNINTIFVHDPQGFTITNETFPFAFGLQDKYATHFIDSQIYTVTATYKYFKRKTVNNTIVLDTSQTPLTLIRCTDAGLSHSDFNNVDLANMFCLEEFIKPNTTLKIMGVYESDVWGFLELKFSRCSSNCKPQSEIDDMLVKGYFAINYIDRTLKSSNYNDPVQTYPTSYFTATSTTFAKAVTLRFQDQEVLTHSSLVGYMAPSSLKFSNVKNFVSDINAISSTTPVSTFFMIQLRMDQLKVEVNRNYQMVYQYLAEFGGLIQVVALGALILTYRLAKTHLTIDLLKTLVNQNNPLDLLSSDSSGNLFVEQPQEGNPSTLTNNLTTKFTKVMPKEDIPKNHILGINPLQKHHLSDKVKEVDPTPKTSIKKKKIFMAPQKKEEQRELPQTPQDSSHRMKLSDFENEDAHKVPPSRFEMQANKNGPKFNENQLQKKDSDLGISEIPNLEKIHNEEIEDWNFSGETSTKPKLDNGNKFGTKLQTYQVNEEAEHNPREEKSNNPATGDSSEALSSCLYKKALLKDAIKNVTTCDRIKYSLFSFCMKGAPVDRLFDFAHSHIETKFDMTGLLKIIHDFDKLLRIIFTPEQRLLFDLIPSGAVLGMASDENGILKSNVPMTYQNKVTGLKHARTSLESIIRSPSPSTADKNFLAHLGFLLSLDLQGSSKDV